MAVAMDQQVYYDPYDAETWSDPYPVFRRLRDEAPLYFNERYEFYAVSRFADVERGLVDRETFLSSRGDILEMIKAAISGDLEIPPGTLIFEEPPTHTIHRALLSRLFTPKQMSRLESKVRDFCKRRLDLFVGAETFNFVSDLGMQIPMRVISMLLGIPESEQEAIRDHFEQTMRSEPGKPMEVNNTLEGSLFADYVDWRYDHPSDDLMTLLLTAEFEDERGTVRRLMRDEVLTFVTVLAGAGNETTNRLFGWMGKLLGENPDVRHELVENRSLIPNTIEEILRYEPISQIVGRYVGRDVELHGQTVKEGSVMLFLLGSANRDERMFLDSDRFDIHRKIGRHLGFGCGPHFCLGASLARLEGRVGLDEVLNRFPDWEVDSNKTVFRMLSVSGRGWDSMPVFLK